MKKPGAFSFVASQENEKPHVQQASAVSFHHFFAQALVSADAWTLPIELGYFLIYSYIHLPYHTLHRAVLLACVLCIRISPSFWVAAAQHQLVTCDNLTMVLGNLLMILVRPTKEVGRLSS